MSAFCVLVTYIGDVLGMSLHVKFKVIVWRIQVHCETMRYFVTNLVNIKNSDFTYYT